MQEDGTIYKTTAAPLKLAVIQEYRQAFNLFTDSNNKPIGEQLTDTQITIIDIIVSRRYRRTELILPTQYGKSLCVGLGVLFRVAFNPEKWAIIAPTTEKAKIIMDYIIDHIFDHKVFLQKLEFDGTKEKLKQERSKARITFSGGGEVRIYTADARNPTNVKKALMGFGSPNIVLDESALMSDDLYSTVKRMLGGSKDNFLLEIGNPFFRNHFFRMWNNAKYVKIYANADTALAEGRFTQEFLDEMKDEAYYDVLYECHFPNEDELLPGGYRQLLSYAFIQNALIKHEPPLGHSADGTLLDRPILGIDPNHGGANMTVMVVRFPLTGYAKVELKKRYADNRDVTGDIIADAIQIIRKYDIQEYRVGVDAGGVGAGVADGLANRFFVQPILFGEPAEDKEHYANKKAELFWRLRKWVRNDNGKLLEDTGFMELKDINYKETSTSKLQMEPKEELAKRGIASPDTADALALTFVSVDDIVDDDADTDII